MKDHTDRGLPALTVDIAGLARLVERRGKDFAVMELVQNAWDEDVTRVDVVLEYLGNGRTLLCVSDDSPDGFHDLSHAYTLFADSKKKGDAEKRGRFNVGEKLVIALADEAKVVSTTGGIVFDPVKNLRVETDERTERGSVFTATLRMDEGECEGAERRFSQLVGPEGVVTTLNGEPLPRREPVRTFEALLVTEIADADGTLRPTRRKCEVQLFEPTEGERASVYEMGLPVVETGDRWHVNVMQKVPLNTDRDNVTPSFLRDLRAHTLNEAADLLDAEDAKAAWVTEALTADKTTAEAVEAVLDQRFGSKRVAYDPSDREANGRAMSEGYAVIHAGSLPREAWTKVRAGGFALPAGKVTPSPSAYGDGDETRPVIDPADYTPGMRLVADFAHMLAEEVLGHGVQVKIVNDVTWYPAATYGPSGVLTFNKGKLGNAWFDRAAIDAEVIDLIIHEYGHEYESDHLSANYYRALTRICAATVTLALDRPELFAPFGLGAVAVT
jgi:hypothetical protein